MTDDELQLAIKQLKKHGYAVTKPKPKSRATAGKGWSLRWRDQPKRTAEVRKTHPRSPMIKHACIALNNVPGLPRGTVHKLLDDKGRPITRAEIANAYAAEEYARLTATSETNDIMTRTIRSLAHEWGAQRGSKRFSAKPLACPASGVNAILRGVGPAADEPLSFIQERRDGSYTIDRIISMHQVDRATAEPAKITGIRKCVSRFATFIRWLNTEVWDRELNELHRPALELRNPTTLALTELRAFRAPDKAVDYLESDELVRFLDIARVHYGGKLFLTTAIQIYAGFRVDEASTVLTWDMYDGTPRVGYPYGRLRLDVGTKVRTGEEVRLLRPLRNILEAVPVDQRQGKISGLSTTPESGAFHTINRKAKNTPATGIAWHLLRHSFGTLLGELTPAISTRHLKHFMRHKKTTVTDLYVANTDRSLEPIIEQASDYFEASIKH